MKLFSLVAVFSSLLAVSAAPVAEPDDAFMAAALGNSPSSQPHVLFERAQKKTCSKSFTTTGKCNGTSCRWAGFVNEKCKHGSCVGNGGGDGACCGWSRDKDGAICPNGGF